MNPLVRQFVVACVCAIGLLLLVRALNHHLGALHLHLGVSGLLIALAALRMHPKPAMGAAFTVGLALDAAAPVYFGQSSLILLALACIVIGIRHRIPREELPVGIAVAVIINLFVFIARTIWVAPDWPDPGTGWLRVFSDLVASQIFIVVIAPWFFALQQHALAWLGAGPANVNSRY